MNEKDMEEIERIKSHLNYDKLQETPNTLNIPEIPKYSQDEIEDKITEWNKNPVIKENNIKAINKDKEKPVKKRNYTLLIILAMIGFLAILGLIGIMAYSVYTTGNVIPNFNVTCSDLNINEGAIKCDLSCPSIEIPSCPSNICPDCNVRTYCGNESD